MEQQTNNSRKKRRWSFWLILGSLLATTTVLVGWQYAKRTVRNTVTKELSKLEFGSVEIGNVSLSRSGVTAHKIQFRRKEDNESWLKIERLRIHHPLGELIKGADDFNGIELSQVNASINLDKLDFERIENYSGTELLDSILREFDLPAKKITIAKSQAVLRTTDRPDFLIDNIDATLDKTEQGAAIQGSIESLLGGQWKFEGNLDRDAVTAIVQIDAPDLQLKSKTWHTLPVVPENIRNVFHADGNLSVGLAMLYNTDAGVQISGTGQIQSLQLQFPALGLPLKIRSGEIALEDGTVTVDNLVATIDDNDRIRGRLETRTTEFPIATSFDVNFSDVTAVSWRRLVNGLPEELSALTSGTASGNVQVHRSTRVIVDVLARGTSIGPRYDQILAETSSADVQISSLVFDEQQILESIDGAVDVSAVAADQPIANVMRTFALLDLEQQLDISGEGNGQVQLHIPLEAADQIDQWNMSVEASVATGTIGDQNIRNVVASIVLEDGRLDFDPIQGTAFDKLATDSFATGNNLNLSVQWPIATANNESSPGRIEIVGTEVPTRWINGFLQHQIRKSNVGRETEGQAFETLNGNTNFQAQIDIPVASPSDLESWNVTGSVSNSTIDFKNQRMTEIAANLGFAKGVLTVADASGHVDSAGSVSANVQLDLLGNGGQQVTAFAKNLSFPWIVELIHSIWPERYRSEQIGRLSAIASGDKLGGAMDVQIQYHRDAARDSGYMIRLEANSPRLTLDETTIKRLRLEGQYDGARLTVAQAKGELDGDGFFSATGDWLVNGNQGDLSFNWNRLPLSMLSQLQTGIPTGLRGLTDGDLTLESTGRLDQLQINGSIGILDVALEGIQARDIAVDLATRDGAVVFENFRNRKQKIGVELLGSIRLNRPYRFDATGKVDELRLSQVFQPPSVVDEGDKTIDLTGIATGELQIAGQLEDFDWQSSGRISIKQPNINRQRLSDIDISWKHLGSDWKQSRLEIAAFEGKINLKELVRKPERIRLEMEGVDVEQVASVLELPVKLTGRLDGNASLNEWSVLETRWADLQLSGASLLLGAAEFGDFQAQVEYRKKELKYDFSGTLLGGNLTGQGVTALAPEIVNSKFPMQISLTNASLTTIARSSNQYRSLRRLEGRLFAQAEFNFGFSDSPTGDGRVQIEELKWNQSLLTRQSSVHFALADQRISFNDVKADLKRGTISAKAILPLVGTAPGSYELEIQNLDFDRLMEIVADDSIQADGLFDARISGQIGKTISGRGFVGARNATVNGLASRSLRIPIQFIASPLSGSGKIELRQSSFRMFDGNVTGEAEISFGNAINIDTDIMFADVDTGKLLASVANLQNSKQGKLTGRVQLKGRGVRSLRDLNGTFRGSLNRVSAFQLPVLNAVANFLSRSQLRSGNYDSDEIFLLLDNARVEIRQLNLSSSLAKVAITGFAYLDGRLDVNVAARIERLQQPTLLDEIAGSPLARLSNNPAAFFAQAAEFLSGRVVFLKIGGTFARPQVRLNSGEQIREELIRYFLRGSQILPNETR